MFYMRKLVEKVDGSTHLYPNICLSLFYLVMIRRALPHVWLPLSDFSTVQQLVEFKFVELFSFQFIFLNIRFCAPQTFIIILLQYFLIKYSKSQEGQHVGQFCWKNKFYP